VDIGRKPFTLTYHIRPEARWSDGLPVTAADFQFTQRTFARYETADIPRRWTYRKVRRSRVLDAKTFRVELREPFAGWRGLYEAVLPRHALLGRDVTKVWTDRIDNPATGAPIGSGPFLVSSWERGSRVSLVRNPRYWGPHASYLDRLVFRFARPDPNDPLGPVRRGEVDVALGLGGRFISADIADEARKLPGWRILAWPAPGMEHLVFRVGPGGHRALRSKLVRQALAFGIDRVAIARAILREVPGAGRRPLDSTTFLPTEASYRPAWSRYRYSPARAQRLLEQAGCRRGSDRIYSCAGERLRLRFVTTAGDPVRERTLELAEQHLRAIGVDVELMFATRNAVFEQILPRGEFDAALFAWVTTGDGVAWPDVWCGHAQNWGGYCNRLTQRDLKQTDLIVDPRQRARVLNAANAKLANAVPVLPVVQPVLRAVVRTNVRGVVAGGSQFNFSQNTEDWWLADLR
jgi:peptide/nickel transport system substrate-binding protein